MPGARLQPHARDERRPDITAPRRDFGLEERYCFAPVYLLQVAQHGSRFSALIDARPNTAKWLRRSRPLWITPHCRQF